MNFSFLKVEQMCNRDLGFAVLLCCLVGTESWGMKTVWFCRAGELVHVSICSTALLSYTPIPLGFEMGVYFIPTDRIPHC